MRFFGSMDWNERVWQRSVEFFGEFMEPLVGGLGQQERREGAALYVQGLLLPGGRKSVEPMAERLGVARRTGLPLVNTEGWSLVTWKDGPGLEWDWLLDITEFAIRHVCSTGRYAAICTSNFCGPQYAGMWRDVAWHQRLTAQIKSALILVP